VDVLLKAKMIENARRLDTLNRYLSEMESFLEEEKAALESLRQVRQGKGTDRSVAGSPCRVVHSDNICDGGTGK